MLALRQLKEKEKHVGTYMVLEVWEGYEDWEAPGS